MKHHARFIIVVFSLISLSCFGQSDTSFFGRASRLVSKWRTDNPIEKVHLHLDKPYYAAGDDIWFKAYVITGSQHLLSAVSGVLNVELINPGDSVQQLLKLPLISGLSWGDFKLPDTIKQGSYRIRAYTNWMRNAGEAYFYDQAIIIGNNITYRKAEKSAGHQKPDRAATSPVKKTEPLSLKADVQFFAEGGTMVCGLPSKIAFKAVGSDGLGKEVSGVVTDSQNRDVVHFSTEHLGMGVFTFVPDSGQSYSARISFTDGSQLTAGLPAPEKDGFVLTAEASDPEKIIVKIQAARSSLYTSQGVYLIAQAGGEIYYAATGKPGALSFSAVVPKRRLPGGIVQFTLFSAGGEPLNERLVFVKNSDQLDLLISAKNEERPRQKVQFNLKAGTENDFPARGNFSVSVIDESKVPADQTEEATIFSDLLLSSDLKGYIEKPNYYFTQVNAKTAADLDVLMLTQGYRRFEWKQILRGKFTPISFPPENALAVSGRISTLWGKPLAFGKVSLLNSSRGFFMLDTVSDNNGKFAFRNLQFKDSSKFVIQSKTRGDKKNVRLELDKPYPLVAGKGKTIPIQPARIKDSIAVYLANSKSVYDQEIKYGIGNHTHLLKEVRVRDRRVLPHSTNLNGSGVADQVLVSKDLDKGHNDIISCLGVNLTGVFVQYDIYGQGHLSGYRQGVTKQIKIMLDGFLIDEESLRSLPIELVESVEFLKSGALTSIYGPEAYNGLVLINTKRGDASRPAAPNIITFMPKGFYKARQFYSPQYDDPRENTQMADLRSTIYWNPNIHTDSAGRASFNYFNSDSRASYRVTIEGIDAQGHIGRLVYRYQVK